jgi:hypothetical protein
MEILHTYLDPSCSACCHGVLDNPVKPSWQLVEHIKESHNYVQNLRFPKQFCLGLRPSSPQKYPYFDIVVGLVWSHDPKSYAGSNACYW